jgi:hypothetical protein
MESYTFAFFACPYEGIRLQIKLCNLKLFNRKAVTDKLYEVISQWNMVAFIDNSKDRVDRQANSVPLW